MPWLFGCLALLFPRLVLVLVWLFGGNYLDSVYRNVLLLLAGFLFLPLTTLTFAFASHSLAAGQQLTALGWLLTGLAALVDLGLLGSQRRTRWRRSEV
jgi:hypothetical protein